MSSLALIVALTFGLTACSGTGGGEAASPLTTTTPGPTSTEGATTSTYVATSEAFEARGTWPGLPARNIGGTPTVQSLTAIDGSDQVVVHLTVGPVLTLSSVVQPGFACPEVGDVATTAAVPVGYALYVASSAPASVRLDLDPVRLDDDTSLLVASNLRDASCGTRQPTARTTAQPHDAVTQGAAWVLIPRAVDSLGAISPSVTGYALQPKLGVGASVDRPVRASQTNGYALPVVDGCPPTALCVPFGTSS